MKSQQPTYIQLDIGEDIASIRDRLSFIRGQRVLIIWPENGTALTRKLDLVFIQREARRRVLHVALVTHDETVINHANELGISTYETINEAEKARWKRGKTRVFVNRHHKPEDAPDPDDLMPVASRVRNPRKRMPAPLKFFVRLSILTLVASILFGLVYVVVPSATVTFAMTQELIQVSTTITADPNALDIDVENRIIPATSYEVFVQTVQQIETTGTEQGSSTRAVGDVLFSNNTNSPINVPIGTQVRTSTGDAVIFETSIGTTIPANDSVNNIPIIAIEDFTGDIGNVDANTINTVLGDLSEDVSVINNNATLGGVNQEYNIVTADDMEYLRGQARQNLQALAFSEISAQLSDDQTIIIESINIPEELLRNDWIEYSHTMGDRTDLISLDLRVIVQALVIDDRFAQQIMFAQVSAEKPPDMVLNPDSFLYRSGAVIETTLDNITTFEAFGEGIASAEVDVFQLQSDLTRRPLDEAQRLIAATVDIASNSQPIIEITPSWFNRMPILPIRIDIQIEGDE